jgi:hypothetical protein
MQVLLSVCCRISTVVLAAVCLSASLIGQQFDTTAPAVTALNLTPAALDSRSGATYATVKATITDDLSGTSRIYLHLRNAQNPQQIVTADLNPAEPFVKNVGQHWEGRANFSADSAAGVWTPDLLYVADTVGNYSYLYRGSDPYVSALPTINLTSNNDTTGPVVNSFNILSSAPLDVTTAAGQVVVNVDVTDPGAGSPYPSLMMYIFFGTSGFQRRYPVDYTVVSSDSVNLPGGGTKVTHRVWRATFTMPRYSAPGKWVISGNVYDNVQNYSPLSSLTFDIVDSTPDTQGPRLDLLKLPYYIVPGPTVQGAQDVKVTVGVSVSDLFTKPKPSAPGCDSYISLSGPHSQQYRIGYFEESAPNSAFWTTTLFFPEYSEGGAWQPYISLCDEVGNRTNYMLIDMPAGTQTPVLFFNSVFSDGQVTAASPTVTNLGDDGGSTEATVTIPSASVTLSDGRTVANPFVTIDTYSAPWKAKDPPDPKDPPPFMGVNTSGSVFMSVAFAEQNKGNAIAGATVSCAAPYYGATLVVPWNLSAIPDAPWILKYIDNKTGQWSTAKDCKTDTEAFGTLSADGKSVTYQHISQFSVFFAGQLTAIPGDLNTDRRVDCADVAIVKAAFNTQRSQPGFDFRADTNGDGVINIKDLSFVTQNLPAGTVCH